MNPSPPQRPPTGGMRFETRLLLGAIGVAVPGLVATLALVWTRPAAGTVVVVLAAAFMITLMLALRLRNRVAFSLHTVSNLLEALREGDYSLRGSRARRGDAIGEVIWEVNALGATLREQRLRVEETLSLLSKVLQAIDIALFTFDADGRLRLINPAGERLIGLRQADAIDRSAEALGLADVLAVSGAATLRRAFPGGSGSFEVRRASFREGGLPQELVVISDLSRALREEERAAWQRLIRVLGHEINNSLAPIKSMADTLARLLAREPLPGDWREDAESGLRVVGERADSLGRFIQGYTTLAKLPAPARRTTDLGALVRRVAALAWPVPVRVGSAPAIEAHVDADQVEQALINLVKNACEAAQATAGGVDVALAADAALATIEVRDEGPGLGSADNLFVPFFTTKAGGSGIGLVLARQIAEAHGGGIALADRGDRSGCRARLSLPLASA